MNSKLPRSTLLVSAAVSACSALLIFFFLSALYKGRHPDLPSSDSAIRLYSSQDGDDLGLIYRSAIERAERSVLLVIYALSDPTVINSLIKQSQKGIQVEVIADASASRDLRYKLPAPCRLTLRSSIGLMHQKILVIDNEEVWIGSANMTTESLRMHGNLVQGIQSSDLAKKLVRAGDGLAFAESCSRFCVDGQDLELWVLPSPSASDRIVELLDAAEESIKVAMFTWTHQLLAEAVIRAHERGVHVEIVLDHSSAKGASKRICDRLRQAGVDVRLSRGLGLLHYKMLIIDDEVLVNGSANWTLSAFRDNTDIFLLTSPLSIEQYKRLKRLWEVIHLESSKI